VAGPVADVLTTMLTQVTFQIPPLHERKVLVDR